MGEDGGVIARPRADVQDGLALLEGERRETLSVQRRLAVVDAPPGVDRHQNVVVKAATSRSPPVGRRRPPDTRHGGGPEKSSRGTAA